MEIDPRKFDYAWHVFVPWLVESKGMSDAKARTVVGRAAKYVPKQIWWHWLHQMILLDPAEPLTYMQAALKPFMDPHIARGKTNPAKQPWEIMGYATQDEWIKAMRDRPDDPLRKYMEQRR